MTEIALRPCIMVRDPSNSEEITLSHASTFCTMTMTQDTLNQIPSCNSVSFPEISGPSDITDSQVHFAKLIPANSQDEPKDSNARVSPQGIDAAVATTDQKEILVWDYAADLAMRPNCSKTQPNLSLVTPNQNSIPSFHSLNHLPGHNEVIFNVEERDKTDGKSLPTSEEDDQNQSLFTTAQTVSTNDILSIPGKSSIERKAKAILNNSKNAMTFVSSPELFNFSIDKKPDTAQDLIDYKERLPMPNKVSSSYSPSASFSADTARFILDNNDLSILHSTPTATKMADCDEKDQLTETGLQQNSEISEISTTMMEEGILDASFSNGPNVFVSQSCPVSYRPRSTLTPRSNLTTEEASFNGPHELSCTQCRRFSLDIGTNVNSANMGPHKSHSKAVPVRNGSTCSQFTLTEFDVTSSVGNSPCGDRSSSLSYLKEVLECASSVCQAIIDEQRIRSRYKCTQNPKFRPMVSEAKESRIRNRTHEIDAQSKRLERMMSQLNTTSENYIHCRPKCPFRMTPVSEVTIDPGPHTNQHRSGDSQPACAYELFVKPYVPHSNELQGTFEEKMCKFLERSQERVRHLKVRSHQMQGTSKSARSSKKLHENKWTPPTVDPKVEILRLRRAQMLRYGDKVRKALLKKTND